jgi:NADPH2:quinone reductase
MHAIRQHVFGPPEALVLEEAPDPEPGPGELRIAVRAAGVHLIDTTIRSGQGGGPFPLPPLPMTPGREVAGVVDAVGPGVDASWVGRRAVAHLGPAGGGGYAELAVRQADAVLATPDGVSDEVAVAMVGTGRTTLGILEASPIAPDDVVLVTAAAGGIGSLLVQAALGAGATVVGLAGGPAKVAEVEKLGGLGVDYRADGWPDAVRAATEGRDVTLAFDGVGGEPARQVLGLLGVAGRMAVYGFSSGAPMALTTGDLFAKSLTVGVVIGGRLLQRPGGFRPLEEAALAAAADGSLVPLVHPPFPLADAAAAHRALEGRETVGKVVLAP